jgi:hypothetical protein
VPDSPRYTLSTRRTRRISRLLAAGRSPLKGKVRELSEGRPKGFVMLEARFTVRRLMLAVAVAASLLGVLVGHPSSFDR